MAFGDLREALQRLRERGEVFELEGDVSPRHEMAACVALAEGRGPGAVLIRSTVGPPVPVVANVAHSRSVVALGMGVEPSEVVEALAERLLRRIAPLPAARAPILEVESSGEALSDVLPILTHYSGDSGPFITTGLISAREPETGALFRGIHRMELRGPDRLGVALINPPLGDLYRRARGRGERVPAAVVVGLDPVTFLACALKVPGGEDKLGAAGGLRGEAVELTPAPLTGIEVPARAEFLLEGEIDPTDEGPDGPLGEISGYSLTFAATPTFRVKALRHRAEPLYHALLPTSREADLLLTLVAEATLDPALRKAFPCLKQIAFAPRTFGSCLAARVGRASSAEVRSLLVRLLALPMAKKVVAVAEDVDPTNPSEVEWSLATRCQPDADLIVVSGLKGQPIDPSSSTGFGTAKVGIDATGYGKEACAGRALLSAEALARVRALIERGSFHV